MIHLSLLGEPRRYFEAIPIILTSAMEREITKILSLGSSPFAVDQINSVIKENLSPMR